MHNTNFRSAEAIKKKRGTQKPDEMHPGNNKTPKQERAQSTLRPKLRDQITNTDTQQQGRPVVAEGALPGATAVARERPALPPIHASEKHHGIPAQIKDRGTLNFKDLQRV